MSYVKKETATEMHTRTTGTVVRLRGRVLLVARSLWLAFALFYLILFGINLLQPLLGSQTLICPLFSTCPPDAATLSALQQTHISLAAYTIYITVFGLLWALICIGFSVLLFWRVFDQPVALFASFSFLFLGSGALTGDLSRLPTAVHAFVNVQLIFLLFCLGFFLVTFPDGRFVPRWSWLIGCTLVAQAVFFMLPGPFNILSWPVPLFRFELVLAWGSPIAVQIYRYRRVSTPVQRQQTKWFIFGLISFLMLLLLQGLMAQFVQPTTIGGAFFSLVSPTLPALGFLLIPLSITLAILRSRLWDIDVIIRRTLVYSTLTVILALLYLGLVISLGSLVRLLTGQAGQSPVSIVASTLVIAALFQPLRRRIQAIIDLRFYRRKYDAAKTVEAFSATLRNELDLNQLHEHLITVVQDTMQPSHISLWLREPAKQPPHADHTQS